MSLKHGILGLLNSGPMTGYELDRSFKRSLSFFWQAQTSQIYRELTAMEKKGWLISERVVQEDKPNKKVYSLTETGEEELKKWLATPEADIENALSIRSAFLMRVFFAGETTEEEALVLLRAFREKCLESISANDSVYESIENYGKREVNEKRMKYWELTARFGEIHQKAALEWVEEAISRLEKSNSNS